MRILQPFWQREVSYSLIFFFLTFIFFYLALWNQLFSYSLIFSQSQLLTFLSQNILNAFHSSGLFLFLVHRVIFFLQVHYDESNDFGKTFSHMLLMLKGLIQLCWKNVICLQILFLLSRVNKAFSLRQQTNENQLENLFCFKR